MNSARRTYALIIGLLVSAFVVLMVTDSVFQTDAAAADSGDGKIYLPITLSKSQEAKPLFSEFQADTELTDEQKTIFSTLRGDLTTVRLSLVIADVELLKDAKAISLNIFGDTVVKVTMDRIERRANEDFTWFGSNPSTGTMATIVVDGENAIGTVLHEGAVYKLVPIGEGIHANAQVDYGSSGDEHPPEYDQMERESQYKRNSSSLATVEKIRLLVVYTPESIEQVASMDALVRLAVDETKQSFRNSGITKEVVLTYKTKDRLR